MRIVCWQTILMKYHALFFRKSRKMLQNLSSAAVVIGALRVKPKNRFNKQWHRASVSMHWLICSYVLFIYDINMFYHMGLYARKPVFRGSGTTQAQTSLHIRAV